MSLSPLTFANDPHALLLGLYHAAVQRALPLHNTAAHLPTPPDPKKGRTLVLGAGKAGGAMA
jgi:hydroxypyruvate reductase